MKKEVLKQLIRYRQIRNLYNKYERVLIPGTLVFGVIVDSITFASINIMLAFCLLGVYLIIAGAAIAFINAYDADCLQKDRRVFQYLRLAAPLAIQFTFGALLSASFIFYFFSGTLFVSWPFIVLIVLLMIANDLLRHHYLRPIVQISVYFFIVFSIFSIILPFVWKDTGVLLFLSSGIASLILMYGYIWLLSRIIPQIKSRRRYLAITVIIIFACINGLYFLNIIPPIPLSLKDAVLAHNLQRVGNTYTLTVEEESLWQRIVPGQTFHKQTYGRMFVYTAIFAPKNLSATIIHNWQRYDEDANKWVTKDKLSFNIIGGAEIGYRGYSVKSNVLPGSWRVDVENKRGQVLGRVKFGVLPVEEPLELKSVVK